MTRKFIPFELERWQSRWEHRVRYNISESGVHPLSVGELLAIGSVDPDKLHSIRFGYTQGNGSDELRDAIAALYPDCRRENVITTTGSSEATFIISWALIEPGDEVAVLTPTYLQAWGLAQNLGASVRTFDLEFENSWEPSRESVETAISANTKLVVVTNPNNPTGHILSEETRNVILECAQKTKAWLLVDEVYQGAELNGETTQSFWGSYERVIVTSGLSKAYGLPGLRIGWVVAQPELIEQLWARHDYTVICPTPTSDFLAQVTLANRSAVLSRTREILNTNLPILEQWLNKFSTDLEWLPPQAGAICWVRHPGNPQTPELAEFLRTEHNLLIVPGEHFGKPGFMRLGYGNESGELRAALAALEAGLRERADWSSFVQVAP